jgi:ABC transporter transmembrane region 2
VKNVPLFLRNIGENVLLCLAASGIEATSKRCLKLMDLQWQQHLTSRIHRHYFQNMVRMYMQPHTANRPVLLLSHYLCRTIYRPLKREC